MLHEAAVLRLPDRAAISLAAPLPTRSGTHIPERSTRSLPAGPAVPPVAETKDGRELHDLARGGVYRAPDVATRAVRSYRTLSPLPVLVGRISESTLRGADSDVDSQT